MEKTTFGEHLRREREMRGVSLDEISTATRISVRFLEALENEQWDRLPGGVFNRGFIRAVARFLGLNEENLVGEYASLTQDKPEKAVWATSTSADRPSTEKSPRGHAWAWTFLVFVILLGVGGAWGWREYGATLQSWRNPPPTPPPVQMPPAPESAPATGAADAAAPPAGVPAASDTAPNSANEPEMLELKVEATQATELTVASDGKTVFDGRMKPGGAQQFKARDRFDVSARNSTAILLDLNGQTLAPPGLPGAPGKITLTRKDLKKP
jgi:cytoskeletal protein RodZ